VNLYLRIYLQFMKLGHAFLNDVSRVRHVLDTDAHMTLVQYVLVKCPIQKNIFFSNWKFTVLTHF